MTPGASVRWALGTSLLLHGALMLGLKTLPMPDARAPDDARSLVEIHVTSAESTPPSVAAVPVNRTLVPEVVPGGARSHGFLDHVDRHGRGGDGAAPEPGVLLFQFVSSVTLQDTDLNNLAVNQAQRIRTARDRATLEQRRATPNAGDEVFLASGRGRHRERRPLARRDAASGALVTRSALQQGAARLGAATDHGGTDLAGGEQLGRARAQTGAGILGGRGETASRAARVGHGRPNVDRGPAATTAGEQDARIRDNVDAELLAARLQRSFVEASTQRAERRGAGTGGPQSDGAGLGLRGVGVGASASPYAPGHGSDFALDTRDSRYLRWITEQRARIRKALVFPLARALAKDQGTTIYRVIVQRNGRLSGTPRLIRSSGFADFDAAAQAAIRHATPFPPLPKGLAPEQESFAILIPIAFDNPMVE